MRKAMPLGAITALLVGCTADKPAPTAVEFRVPLFVASDHAGGNGDINLGTHLTGDEEVCPTCTTSTPADSKGQGEAVFRVNDEVTVDFRLIASNIYNVVQAHIHCGAKETNGPIKMWLYPTIGPSGTALTGPTGRQNGVLASGTFSPGSVTCTASDGSTISLLAAMRAGLTYVNVHTNDGAAPPNTGPGDFPGGEIRGQIDDENR
jgi:hypothetical protein